MAGPPAICLTLRDILAWCRAFIALASFGRRFGSASRMEALGLIYLPSQGPLHELAESLLHEAMHQHLSRLDGVAPLFTEESRYLAGALLLPLAGRPPPAHHGPSWGICFHRCS